MGPTCCNPICSNLLKSVPSVQSLRYPYSSAVAHKRPLALVTTTVAPHSLVRYLSLRCTTIASNMAASCITFDLPPPAQKAQEAMRKAEEAAREDSQGKREAFKLEDLKCEHCHAVAEEMVGCCRSMHLAATKTATAPPLFTMVAITAITDS